MLQDVYLTKEGFERLKGELNVLKGKKRREIADAIDKARQLGDLSENAEYDSAKQSQALNEKRIADIEYKLARARVIENVPIGSDKAYLGARLKLLDIDSKEELIYTLVTEDEADFSKGRISITSPVGKGLLGKKKDDIVNIKIPAGELKYKILEIGREI